MYDSVQSLERCLSKGVGMEEKHQSDSGLTDEEVVKRWMNYGRQINEALEAADYDEVSALVDDRGRLLGKLEESAGRLSEDQRQSLLDAEEELQESMQKHRDYMRKKLSGLGRMKLGVRKYAGR